MGKDSQERKNALKCPYLWVHYTLIASLYLYIKLCTMLILSQNIQLRRMAVKILQPLLHAYLTYFKFYHF